MRTFLMTAIVALVLAAAGSLTAPNKAHAGSFSFSASVSPADLFDFSSLYTNDPCPPDVRNHITNRLSQALELFRTQAIEAINAPEHVKQVVDCLENLFNVGISILGGFSLPNLSAIFSGIINQLCEAVTSQWENMLGQLTANIQLPNIPINILGREYPGFSGQIGGGFRRGMPTGEVNIEIDTPAGNFGAPFNITR